MGDRLGIPCVVDFFLYFSFPSLYCRISGPSGTREKAPLSLILWPCSSEFLTPSYYSYYSWTGSQSVAWKSHIIRRTTQSPNHAAPPPAFYRPDRRDDSDSDSANMLKAHSRHKSTGGTLYCSALHYRLEINKDAQTVSLSDILLFIRSFWRG